MLVLWADEPGVTVHSALGNAVAVWNWAGYEPVLTGRVTRAVVPALSRPVADVALTGRGLGVSFSLSHSGGSLVGWIVGRAIRFFLL